ncbi:uncharacterized protein PG986_004152 [Apiospora aurea]|uniref:Zn(2)-C6 fungal-type domain-containing protein n=1 Tax=Apiospora aurea TaxID=335848 RepID=A0ABR1QLR7_9PEZI
MPGNSGNDGGDCALLPTQLQLSYPATQNNATEVKCMSGELPSRVMDNPEFHDFLDSISESDPTTLQSLLTGNSEKDANLTNQIAVLPSTEITWFNGIQRMSADDEELHLRTDSALSRHTVHRLSTSAPVPILSPQVSSCRGDGKRKIPSLDQMRKDDCILRLYGESTGRRHKRQKKKGRQCVRCRLKNLKCSDEFPCTSCTEHWKKAVNWANEKRTITWSHCFDARMEDLNVLVDLIHSIMFARTNPRKQSENMTLSHWHPLKHICFVRELVDNFGTDIGLQNCIESQKGKASASSLLGLIDEIHKQLPSDTWTLTPTTYRQLSPPARSSLRLSEIVIVLFFHHDHLREHTNLSSYELYIMTLVFSALFFDQLARHFKSGKIRAIPIGSSMATDLAIDLGTLFLLICYVPVHFPFSDIVDAEETPQNPSADIELERTNEVLQSPDDLLASHRTNRYIFDEIDHFLKSDRHKSARGRNLPFKAATLADRWVFLKEYLSHWMDKVRICSIEPSTVASRIAVAQRLCRLELLSNDEDYGRCDRPLRLHSSMNLNAPNKLENLSTLCRQMEAHWTTRKATETLDAFLQDKRVSTWHLMLMQWLNHNPIPTKTLSESHDLIDLPNLFPIYIRFRIGSVETMEFQLLNAPGSIGTVTPEELDVVRREWRAISAEMNLPPHKLRELVEKDNRIRQTMAESAIKAIWA